MQVFCVSEGNLMPFKKSEDGVVDTNINRGGRPKGKPKTTRQSKIDDLDRLCRKIAPHLTLAVATAVNIMNSKEANDSNKLRAAAFITETYRQLTGQVFNWQEVDDTNDDEIKNAESGAVIFTTQFTGTN